MLAGTRRALLGGKKIPTFLFDLAKTTFTAKIRSGLVLINGERIGDMISWQKYTPK